MGTSILSPMAAPFQPSGLEFAIFNNGVPSSVFYGVHPEHDVVAHIPDEAIDETFPPTANDIAELEAADEFVETMAWLSYLDECDEKARFEFSGLKKRWESRREEGLVGKPHPIRAETRSRSGSGSKILETDLVPFVPRAYEVIPRSKKHAAVPKTVKGSRGHMQPIQQPRKHY